MCLIMSFNRTDIMLHFLLCTLLHHKVKYVFIHGVESEFKALKVKPIGGVWTRFLNIHVAIDLVHSLKEWDIYTGSIS